MSEHRHTLITSTPAERVELHVHTGGSDSRWHRFLNCLWDEGVIASLSDRAYRVLGAILRLRKDDGTAFASIDTLCTLTGYAERSVQAALKELRAHPRRLLAVMGRDVYEVLPGFTFAGRTVLREPPQNPAETRTVLRSPCVPLQEARARQTNQPKTERETQTKSPIPERAAKSLGGWPELDLFGQRAVMAGDVEGLLKNLGVWHYMAEPLARCGAISCERVLREAMGVAADRTAGNRPICLAKRLARSFGVELPPPPKTSQLMAEGRASGMERIAQLRIELMQRSAANARPRGPSAVEYAQQEDES